MNARRSARRAPQQPRRGRGRGVAARAPPNPTPAPIPTPTPASAGRIVFVAPVGNTTELFAIDADGSNRVRLNEDPSFENYPAVSPDGSNRLLRQPRLLQTLGDERRRLEPRATDARPATSATGVVARRHAHRLPRRPRLVRHLRDERRRLETSTKIENGMSGGGKPPGLPTGRDRFVNSTARPTTHSMKRGRRRPSCN